MEIRRENSVVLLQDPPLPISGGVGPPMTIGRRLRTAFAGIVWLTAGGAIVTYGSAIVYANVARIEADSAIVSGTIEAIRAPSGGRLSTELRQGADFMSGDNLFSVRNPELEERIGLASIRVERSRSELALKKSELVAERSRKDNFLLTLRGEIDRLEAQIVALIELEQNAQRRYTITNELYIKGFVTRLRLEDVSDRAAETRANVARARSSESEKTALFAAVAAGRGYGGVGGLGRLEDFEAAVSRAEAEVKLAIEEMRVLMERRADTKITASASGRIVRLLKLDGSTLREGDSVALFERNDERVVYAFLTQADVGRISIGDEADVFLPAQRLNTRARVAAVERSGGYFDDVENHYGYGWRSSRESPTRHTDRDRTARITLRFSDSAQSVAKRDLDPGTPAVVSFQRRWDGSQIMTAYTTLEQVADRIKSRLADAADATSGGVATIQR